MVADQRSARQDRRASAFTPLDVVAGDALLSGETRASRHSRPVGSERGGGFQANSEVGIFGEWSDDGTARLGAEGDKPSQRLPARPCVGVVERRFDEGSQGLSIGVDHRVDRCASHGAARIVEQPAPCRCRDVEIRADEKPRWRPGGSRRLTIRPRRGCGGGHRVGRLAALRALATPVRGFRRDLLGGACPRCRLRSAGRRRVCRSRRARGWVRVTST